MGCNTSPSWMTGGTYQVGSVVRAVCNNGGGGSTVCTPTKTYLWTCFHSAAFCEGYAPGEAGWWAVWTVGMLCN